MNEEAVRDNSGNMREDTMTLILQCYQSGDERLVKLAKEQVIAFYGRYVWKLIVTDYPSFVDKNGDDLFQQGVIGLLEALKTYDGKHAFTTCSKPFIKHEVSAYVSNLTDNKTFYFAKNQKKVKEAIARLEQEETEVTPERIAELTGLSMKIVTRELSVLERTNFVYMDGLKSLDVLQPAEPPKSVETIVEERIMREKLAEGIRKLDEEKKTFLAQYFRRDLPQGGKTLSRYKRRKKFDEICDELKRTMR